MISTWVEDMPQPDTTAIQSRDRTNSMTAMPVPTLRRRTPLKQILMKSPVLEETRLIASLATMQTVNWSHITASTNTLSSRLRPQYIARMMAESCTDSHLPLMDPLPNRSRMMNKPFPLSRTWQRPRNRARVVGFEDQLQLSTMRSFTALCHCVAMRARLTFT